MLYACVVFQLIHVVLLSSEVFSYPTAADSTLKAVKREHEPEEEAAPAKKMKLENDVSRNTINGSRRPLVRFHFHRTTYLLYIL